MSVDSGGGYQFFKTNNTLKLSNIYKSIYYY